jgi:novobiocin biosynthesis protein NovU/D-mycarose 3-C-methyltransferase
MTLASSEVCQAVRACVACGSGDLRPVLDLGPQPLANNLVQPDSPNADPSFPLGIQVCRDCLLVQLHHIVDPGLMFSNYLYVPSTSSTWLEHCEELAEYVCTSGSLSGGELVVEVGSNDGSLLRAFQRRGMRVLGVDPATNIAAQANAAGVPTLNRFFGPETAKEILSDHGQASAVVSTNVLAHVPDPVAVLRAVREILAPNGVYVNESPSLRDMVERNEFDTIYHEHVSYFSLLSLENLFAQAGLELVDALPQAVHGGTLRVLGVHAGAASPSRRVGHLEAAERASGVLEVAGLEAFGQRAARLRELLRASIASISGQDRRVAGYGATAKGNTLLGYCGLAHPTIEYIVDRNPLKQGLCTPGTRIPIVSPDRLTDDPPDVLLLLAWNLADEIRQQQSGFAARGGKFLIPVPEPRLL